MSREPIRDFLEAGVSTGAMPGACWWVGSCTDVVSAGAVGSACLLPRPEPVTQSTCYDLASLTKPLATSLIALLLEQEGRMGLDTPVGDLLPELAGSPHARATLLDLGSHRAGLPAWRPLYLAASNLEGYLRRIALEPPAVARGTTLYSDLGFILLGAAVERASGERLDRLFERYVAEPLGLRGVGFAGAGGSFGPVAATEAGNAYERALAGLEGTGYPWRERLLRGEVHDGNAHGLGGVAGHAGLFGKASEVAGIAREMVRPEKLHLAPRARQRLLGPVAGSGSRSFGFVMARDSAAAKGVLPDEAAGHTGFTGTSLWLDPATERIFVLLTNRVHPVVPREDFQPVRREFHRLATRICEA